MRRTRCVFGMTVLLMLLSSPLLMTSQQRTAIAHNPPTPTAFPLPVYDIPVYPPSQQVVTEEGMTLFIVESDPSMPEIGELVTETEHFLFHVKGEYLPVDLEAFSIAAEEVFDYMSARLETTSDTKTIVLFEPPSGDDCPARGTAQAPREEGISPIITLYADESTSHAQLMGVLAHEVGHALQSVGRERQWGSHHRALNEGVATWAAGQYWHDWQGTPSFEASVRAYLQDSTYLPLYEHYELERAYSGANCLASRDILYTEWAAFIDFLLAEYGVDQFHALLLSNKPDESEIENGESIRFEPADFVGIYGLALNQLEAVWVGSLLAAS